MRMVRLGDLIMPANTQRAGSTSDLPILSMTMHHGLIDQATKFKKRVASADTSAYKVVLAGQLVVGFPIDEGVLSIQTAYPRALVSPAYGIWDIIDLKRVERDYLQKFLKSPPAMSYYAAKLRGSTARRRSLPADVFLSLPVPLPEPHEQRRIAAILDQADRLRRAARDRVQASNQLPMACLRETIAKSASQDRPLSTIARLYGGTSLPAGETFVDQESGSLLMRVSDMNSRGNEDQIFSTAEWSAAAAPPASTVPENTVVIPKRGASIATNKKRLTTRQTVLDPNLMGIVPDGRSMTALFLFTWFRTFDLATITSGSSVPQLNKKDLAPLLVPVPDGHALAEFDRRMAAVGRAKQAARESARSLDALFASLQSRAFRGEL